MQRALTLEGHCREARHGFLPNDRYEACLSATSTTAAPWFVVPADDKENARLVISGIILDTLKRLGMRYPKADKARRKELLSIRKSL